jgi:putative membrane protein (TIGR04086 family)
MRKNTSRRKIELTFPVKNLIGLLVSSLIGATTTLVATLIFSYLISNSETISSYSFIYLIFSVIIGGFLCGFIGSSILPFKGLVSGLMCSALYTIIIYILLFIFSQGNLSAYSFLLVLLMIVSSIIGGITKANTKRRK